MIHDLIRGLGQLLTPEALGLLFVGMTVGMFMGMLPGLGVSLVLSLMLPFLYHLSIVPAVAMMLGAQAGSYYAASITAILLNTPGAPESFPTTLDGFPMAQRGEAGRALAISATSTWAGGWMACAIMIGLLQVAGQLVGLFHPPEFVTIILLALVLIGGTGESAQVTKVILSGAIGFMLSFIGSDPVTGVERFTFGLPSLLSGINVVPFALGVFALTQMVVMYGRKESVAGSGRAVMVAHFRAQVLQGVSDTLRNWAHVVRSAVVAVLLGLIPGIGGFTANFISYSLGRRTSRQGKSFGTGVPAGIASAEGSSLAKEVGSLIPAVALGLPSGLGMVIFIAALSILGIQPGPTLLRSQPALPYTMMWVMAIAGLVSCALGLALSPWLSRVTTVRGPVLFPFILTLAVLGSFAAVTNFAGVVELALFAGLGVVMRKLNYSLAAVTIGLVLGGTFADNVHLTRTIYGWQFFSKSPLADVFAAFAIVLLVLTAVRGRRGGSGSRPTVPGRYRPVSHPILEPATDAVIAAVSIAYVVGMLRYPPNAGRLPAIVASVAAVVALSRLFGWGIEATRARLARPTSNANAISSPAFAGVQGTVLAQPGSALRAAGGPSEGTARFAGNEVGKEARPDLGSPGGQPEDRGRLSREVAALGWVATASAGTFLLGFELGLPLVVAGYCLVGIEWGEKMHKFAFALVTTGAAFAIAFAFVSLFHLTFRGQLLAR